MFLHSWLNIFAELLEFSDRQFYTDWWNSKEFGTYYRRWNIVVHDFLYYYVYVDIIRFSQGKISRKFFINFSISQFIVFAISAVVHEIIVSIVNGYFFPVLFINFIGPGILFIRYAKSNSNSRSLNILFWLQMIFGNGLLFNLYTIEASARRRISNQYAWEKYGYLELIIPRCIMN